MTQTGKCDTCRQRKVKCDEAKPTCSACQKKDRSCTYNYGKPTAFVLQDPNQLTRHGRSKVKDVVLALDSSPSFSSPSIATISGPVTESTVCPISSEELRLTTERPAASGHGIFRTLTPSSNRRGGVAKKAAAHQRKKLREYLLQLQCEAALSTIRPACHSSALIARYVSILGGPSLELSPLAILGTWIQTIPSRIGSNAMTDLAVEFLIDSHAVFWDGSYSNRNRVQASKSRALKELQLVVSRAQGPVPYEALLTTKLHYAAEALAGIDKMYHAIHAFGLAELLKTGKVANVDDEHYWNLIDNTYIDDVNEAILAGRDSVYDNDFYLSSTYPPPFDLPTNVISAHQRASMTLMHVFIQCPRLVNTVRLALANPDDTRALASAVSLGETLLQLNIPSQMEGLLQGSVTEVLNVSFSEIADLAPTSLKFDTVQNMILCTRYWMLQNVLCGIVDTLHRHFSVEAALSLLPDPTTNLQIDVNAALNLAKSLAWSESLSQRLPLVSLRLHTPLQISIGPWHRTIRIHKLSQPSSGHSSPNMPIIDPASLARAERMKDWVIAQCNAIHVRWDVSIVSERPLLEALDTMAGEPIPAWLPVRVRFEAEDGEMVLKLDYQNQRGSYSERFDLESVPQMSEKERIDLTFGSCDAEGPEDDVVELPYRPVAEEVAAKKAYQSFMERPADFVHATGRNLCSTTGWWPTSPSTSTVLLDSTHKAAAFSHLSPPTDSTIAPGELDMDGHPCLASSWWPQGPKSSAEFSQSGASSSPRSSTGQASTTGNNNVKNACISPAWASMQS